MSTIPPLFQHERLDSACFLTRLVVTLMAQHNPQVRLFGELDFLIRFLMPGLGCVTIIMAQPVDYKQVLVSNFKTRDYQCGYLVILGCFLEPKN